MPLENRRETNQSKQLHDTFGEQAQIKKAIGQSVDDNTKRESKYKL